MLGAAVVVAPASPGQPCVTGPVRCWGHRGLGVPPRPGAGQLARPHRCTRRDWDSLFVPGQANEAAGLGWAEPVLSGLQESQVRAQPELGQKGRKDRRTSAAHHPHPSLAAVCGRQGWEGSLCAVPLSVRVGMPLQKRGCWCWEAAGAEGEQEQRSQEHPRALGVPGEPRTWLSARQGLGRG